MSKSGFELNSAGVVELMKSVEMVNVLNEFASSVASRAGGGYGISNVMSGDRAKVFVTASTEEAYADNNENNTLLKALQGGGDD